MIVVGPVHLLRGQEVVMNRFNLLIVALLAIWLPGCISHPQTAEEFRKAVPAAFSAKIETFEVDRPFSQVAGTFQRWGRTACRR